jgi:hypothetical protein
MGGAYMVNISWKGETNLRKRPKTIFQRNCESIDINLSDQNNINAYYYKFIKRKFLACSLNIRLVSDHGHSFHQPKSRVPLHRETNDRLTPPHWFHLKEVSLPSTVLLWHPLCMSTPRPSLLQHRRSQQTVGEWRARLHLSRLKPSVRLLSRRVPDPCSTFWSRRIHGLSKLVVN